MAIELAAARINLLTLPELERHLCERLNVLSGGGASVLRHKTMRATIDWSYDLLSVKERQLFDRLWIFPASFSLDAAVAICGDEQSGRWQIFETLASLVDKSLVNSAPDGSVQRYRMLETTREYAMERIGEPEQEAALRRRHAFYFAGLAQRAASGLESTNSTAAWAQLLEADMENFRASLDWLLKKRGDVAAGARLLSNLQELWIIEGVAAEAEQRARDTLNAEVDLLPELQAALWLTIARMRQELFVHPDGTLEAATNARNLYETSGDLRGLALAVRQQAAAHMRLGDYGRARNEFQQSLDLFQELNDQRMVARGLGYLACLLQVQGEVAQSRSMFLDVLRMAESWGDDRMIPTFSMNLAETEFALGNFEAAAERARANLSNEVLEKSCEMMATQEANLSVYLLALGLVDDARAMALQSIDDASGAFIAVPLQHLAASLAYSDPAAAATILGYVDEAFKSAAFSRENTERFSYEYLNAALQSTLDDTDLTRCRQKGAALNEEQILDVACKATSAKRHGFEAVRVPSTSH